MRSFSASDRGMRCMERVRAVSLAAAAAVASLGLAACGEDDGASAPSAGSSAKRIAIVLPMGDTEVKEIGAAAQRQAKELGLQADVISVPGFTASDQTSRLQTALSSGKYGAILTDPYGPASTAILRQAISKGMKVATVHLPADGNYSRISALPGQTVGLLTPGSKGSAARAEAVVQDCKDRDPCNVAIIQGDKAAGGFEKSLSDAALPIFKRHANIRVVSTQAAASRSGLAPYTVAAGRALAQDIIAANPDVHVILASGDQMWQGAHDVLKQKGLDKTVRSYGGGASVEGVKNIADGIEAGAAPVLLPQTEGCTAVKYLHRALNEGYKGGAKLDPNEIAKTPAVISRETADEITPEWSITGKKVEPVCP